MRRPAQPEGASSACSVMPSWADVEVYTDTGEPVREVKAVTIAMAEGTDPITATIEVYLSSLDIEATIAQASTWHDRVMEGR